MDKRKDEKNDKKWKFRRHRRHGKKPQKAPAEAVEQNTPETISAPAPQVEPEETKVEEKGESTVEIPNVPEEEAESAAELEKTEVVGIRFRPVGKNYSFDPAGLTLSMGTCVVVETSQGNEFGTVSTPNQMKCTKDLVLPLKKVLRIATQKDIERNEENKSLELRARKTFLEKVQEHNLDMALSDVECSFDRSKMIFYFTSEGRVDFREFVKDMASIFKTRIELRQIGVRDEAKQLGGLGICGRPLCCSSFLEDFQQVSIKMAKEQNLSLNPTKISGTCGRLMCCLRYENEVYVEASKKCPKVDSCVMSPQGRGTVIETNVLSAKCKVRLESDPDIPVVFSAEELKVLPKQKKPQDSGKENSEKQVENQ
jgi:cell fate regulator YaaT (PSP1 superfamily)